MKKISALLLALGIMMFNILPIHGEGAQIGLSDTAAVTVDGLPADTTSLKVSFKLTSDALEKAEVSFSFDQGVTSSIREYRYHPDTGILTIYISGTEAIPARLGVLNVTAKDDTEFSVHVSALTDGFQAVTSVLDSMQEVSLADEDGMVIELNKPAETPDDGQGAGEEVPDEDGSSNPGESQDGNTGNDSGQGSADGTQTGSDSETAGKPEIDSGSRGESPETGVRANGAAYAAVLIAAGAGIIAVRKFRKN